MEQSCDAGDEVKAEEPLFHTPLKMPITLRVPPCFLSSEAHVLAMRELMQSNLNLVNV